MICVLTCAQVVYQLTAGPGSARRDWTCHAYDEGTFAKPQAITPIKVGAPGKRHMESYELTCLKSMIRWIWGFGGGGNEANISSRDRFLAAETARGVIGVPQWISSGRMKRLNDVRTTPIFSTVPSIVRVIVSDDAGISRNKTDRIRVSGKIQRPHS